MDYNLLETALQGLGYGNLKKISGSKIAVLTDENRISVLEAIEKKIPAAVYEKSQVQILVLVESRFKTLL